MSTRFFQTTRPEFIDDKMYKAPIDTMMKVIETQDTKADEALDQFKELDDLLKTVSNLEIDDPEVKQRLNQYKQRMLTATNNIYGDAEQFNKTFPELRSMTADISQDIFHGIFKASDEQVKKKQAFDEWVDETYKDINIQSIIKNFAKNKYKIDGGLSYDDASGKHNTYMSSEDFTFKNWDPKTEADLVNLEEEKRVTAEPWISKEKNISSSKKKTETGIFQEQIDLKGEKYIMSSDAKNRLNTKYFMAAFNEGITSQEEIDAYIKSNTERDIEAYWNYLDEKKWIKEDVSGGYSFGPGHRDDARMKRFQVGNSLTIPSDWQTQDNKEDLNTYTSELGLAIQTGDPSNQEEVWKVTQDLLMTAYKGDVAKFTQYLTEEGFAESPEEAYEKLEQMQYFRDLKTNYTTDVYNIQPGDANNEEVFYEKIRVGNGIKQTLHDMLPSQTVYYRYVDNNGVTQDGYKRYDELFPNGTVYMPRKVDYQYNITKDEENKGKVTVKDVAHPDAGKEKVIVQGEAPDAKDLNFYIYYAPESSDRLLYVDYDQKDEDTGSKKYRGVYDKDAYIIRGNFKTLPDGTVGDNFTEVEIFVDKDAIGPVNN